LNVDISEGPEGAIAKGFLDVPVTSQIGPGFTYKFKNKESTLQAGDQVKETRKFKLFIFCKDPKVLLFVVEWGYSLTVDIKADADTTQYTSTPNPSPPSVRSGADEPNADEEIKDADKKGSTNENKPLNPGPGVSFPTLSSP